MLLVSSRVLLYNNNIIIIIIILSQTRGPYHRRIRRHKSTKSG